MKGKKILLGISGSIAAYKIPALIRLLKKQGADVKVVLSSHAQDFVTPLTLSTLAEHPVVSQAFDKVDGSWNSHVELGRWADVMLIAPASAATLSKMANANADNMLITTYLAAKCPVFFAPAMDLDMFHHPSTKNNVEKLISFGNQLIASTSGELASGLCGEGRMQEPEVIVEVLTDFFEDSKRLKGKTALITAGPTYENIDPVRFIGNYSSGKMGVEIALSLAEEGVEVDLVLGPSNLEVNHPLIKLYPVISAQQMFDECMKHYQTKDILLMSAAVADYRPKEISNQKIKKQTEGLSLELENTQDILKTLGEKKTDSQYLIGFALETNNELENAYSKLRNKNANLIVMNSLQNKGAGFGGDTNKVSFVTEDYAKEFPLKSKAKVAEDIVDFICEQVK